MAITEGWKEIIYPLTGTEHKMYEDMAQAMLESLRQSENVVGIVRNKKTFVWKNIADQIEQLPGDVIHNDI